MEFVDLYMPASVEVYAMCSFSKNQFNLCICVSVWAMRVALIVSITIDICSIISDAKNITELTLVIIY